MGLGRSTAAINCKMMKINPTIIIKIPAMNKNNGIPEFAGAGNIKHPKLKNFLFLFYYFILFWILN